MNRITRNVIGSLAIIGFVLPALTIIDAALVDSRCYAQPPPIAPQKIRPVAPTGTIGGRPSRDPGLRASALTAGECKDLGGTVKKDPGCSVDVKGYSGPWDEVVFLRCTMPSGASRCVNQY